MRGMFDIGHDVKFHQSYEKAVVSMTLVLFPFAGSNKLKLRGVDPQLRTPAPLRNKDLLGLIGTFISVDDKREIRTVCKLWAQTISLFPAKFRLRYENLICTQLFGLATYSFGIPKPNYVKHWSLEDSDNEKDAEDSVQMVQ